VQKVHVKPHLLFKPNLSKGGSMPDPDATFRLFDRVVNVRQGFSVPLGLKGTITGGRNAPRAILNFTPWGELCPRGEICPLYRGNVHLFVHPPG
jgi:hypothetical protein